MKKLLHFLLFVTFLTTGCNGLEENQYSAIFMFEEASFKKNQATRFLTSYMLAVDQVNGVNPDIVIEGMNLFFDVFAKGIPIEGKLTIEKDTIKYEPIELFSTIIDGHYAFHIPTNDIVKVSIQNYYNNVIEEYIPFPSFYKAVVIETKKGVIEFVFSRQYYGEEQYEIVYKHLINVLK